ncbi:AAA family ATPase [Nocardia asteroides]|uniref:AAA family ATPase n=1 Tax=Nocardia asteroides TaxID=1824 RepID=UPI001E3533B2|nr:AAA family ATPase [Nocardia asteroides]UGT61795.1 AAA family ATPase [Nocardia asteroides]
MRDDTKLVAPGEIATRAQFAAALCAALQAVGLTRRPAVQRAARFLPDRPGVGGQVPFGTVNGWFSGIAVPDADSPYFVPILRVLGVQDAWEIEQWKRAAARVRAQAHPVRGSRSPYRGLDRFEREDAVDFHGRTGLTTLLCARVDAALAAGSLGIVLVAGPSGVGKSSLLRAGLAAHRPAVVFTPGSDPCAALAAAIAQFAPQSPARILVVDQCEELWTYEPAGDQRGEPRRAWSAQRARFLDDLRGFAAGDGAAVVIGMRADHFGFAAAAPVLAAALTGGEQHLVVVTPMNREDLEQVICAPAAARGVKVEPALVTQLLEEMTGSSSGSGSEPAALPMLSHALDQAWGHLRPPRKELKSADYHRTGGIRGAVAHTAEQIYTGLDSNARLAARRVMTRCVAVTGESAARRTAARSELDWEDLPAETVTAVIASFADQRLLTLTETGVQLAHEILLTAWPRLSGWIDRDRDALLQHRRLTEEATVWEAGGRADKDLISAGRTEDLRGWFARPERERELAPLEREFLDANIAHHTAVTERNRRRASHLAHAVATLKTSQARLRTIVAVLIAVTVLAVGAGAVAVYSRAAAQRAAQQARIARDEAFSRQAAVQSELLRERDPALAQQLALVGYRAAPTLEAASALLDSTAVPTPHRLPAVPGTIATSLDRTGTRLAAAGADGAVRLTDRRAPQPGWAHTITVSAGPLFAVAFAPHRDLLAAGGIEGSWLLDLSGPQPRPLTRLSGPGEGTVYDLAWATDGSELAAATSTGVHRFGAVRENEFIRTALPGADPGAKAVAYSPDGTLLAAAGASARIALFDRVPGTGPVPAGVVAMPRGSDEVLDLAFDPSSTHLAVGSAAREAALYDLTDRARPLATRHFSTFTSFVNAVAFSPDGTTLAAASSDNTTQLFDLTGPRPSLTLPGPSIVTALTHTGTSVITGSTDGAVREWPLPGPVTAPVGGRIYTLPTDAANTVTAAGLIPAGDTPSLVHRYDLTAATPREITPALELDTGASMSGVAVLSEDGRTLAAATQTGELYTWDLTDSARPRRTAIIPVLDTVIAAAVFTPDTTMLFAASSRDDTNRVIVVDRRDPAHPRPGETLTAPGLVQLLSISPDGTTLAAATAHGVGLWDISEGPDRITPLPALTGFDATVTTVRFGPGHLLAAGGDDRTIALFDLTDPRTPRPLAHITGPAATIQSLTFDTTGDQLAAGIGDDQIWLFNISDPSIPQRRAALNAYRGRVNDVAFHHDSRTMTAGGPDATLRTWSTDPDDLAAQLCADPAALITPAEWDQYFPDTPYTAAPCR